MENRDLVPNQLGQSQQNALDHYWDFNTDFHSLANAAHPTQAAPFFQPQNFLIPNYTSFGVGEKDAQMASLPGIDASYGNNHGFPLDSAFTRPTPIKLADRQRSSQNMRAPKRQKVTSYDPQPNAIDESNDAQKRSAPSVAGSEESECCSSCSEGVACAEPDCMPCDKSDCDGEEVEVIPCVRESCAHPPCPNPCLAVGIQTQEQLQSDYGAMSEKTTMNWVDNTKSWTTQMPQNLQIMRRESLEGMLDPTLKILTGDHSGSASPAPTTPSMANNIETPYSPYQENAFFNQQSLYSDQSTGVLSGTGALFTHAPNQWQNQTFDDTYNHGNWFQCTWDGCQETIQNQDEWLPHLHRAHLDPQITFECPISAETCPQTIDGNPVDHLQANHGFEFNMGDNGLSCPAPACAQDETFCNPAMLHHHFDLAHGMPAQGGLQCRLEACNNYFQDFNQFVSHISETHKVAVPAKEDDIDLPTHAEAAKFRGTANGNTLLRNDKPVPIGLDATESSDSDNLRCKWKTGSGDICGHAAKDETELQTHVKEHLIPLDKTSGYFCQWDGCNREEKRGAEGAGFSQRGKLERHMATHTNYKCCKCSHPGCDLAFSAPQALKQHERLHTGAKPWKCDYCGKCFPQQSACTIHMRTHTNEKPLECNICGKRFSESSNLAKHRKIHGEKGKNICTYHGCGKSFHRFDQLKRHALVHKKERARRRANGSVVSSDVGSVISKSENESKRDG